ncbi:hypothetical protein BKA67DRAFT_662165 [Truncatella angustata]|uniref:2EXR domain-containing protein n=1 Tax=Truncatella angustata TaxID=152316 RepID=A0A9P8UCZ0_9PEZI|nr:uncharacterized protein BKA67DRAFT_662165 [Truncatella angustata]KAH6647363.1 hypothetical protein BKA67DRAFT_662165 [Truncatella angustata]
MDNGVFYYFSHLPVELRLAVWDAALSAGSVLGIEEVNRRAGKEYLLLNPFIGWDASDMSQVCRESRLVVIQRCEKIKLPRFLHYISAERPVHWVDFSRTTFHLEPVPNRDYYYAINDFLNLHQTYASKLQYMSFEYVGWPPFGPICACLADYWTSLKAIFILAHEDVFGVDTGHHGHVVDDEDNRWVLPGSVLGYDESQWSAVPPRASISDTLDVGLSCSSIHGGPLLVLPIGYSWYTTVGRSDLRERRVATSV